MWNIIFFHEERARVRAAVTSRDCGYLKQTADWTRLWPGEKNDPNICSSVSGHTVLLWWLIFNLRGSSAWASEKNAEKNAVPRPRWELVLSLYFTETSHNNSQYRWTSSAWARDTDITKRSWKSTLSIKSQFTLTEDYPGITVV